LVADGDRVTRTGACRQCGRSEAAKQRLMLALRVAGSKLQLAKAKVNEMNMNQNKARQVKE